MIVLVYFKMPFLYEMLAGVFLNMFAVPIPSFIWVPANYIADAMIAFALFTLGAQVAQLKFLSSLATGYYSLFLRLISVPLIALVILLFFRVEVFVAQPLFIVSAIP